MPSPFRKILDQCETGFPLWQKWLMTGGVAFYTICPLDVLPDVLPPITYADDLFMVYILVRVWRSPTLRAGATAAARSVHEAGRSLQRRVSGLSQSIRNEEVGR